MTRANKTLGNIANDQTVTNGNASSVTVPLAFDAFSATKMLLDRRVGVIGFCDAMIAVGWMQELNGKISLPNFDRHNGKTAKTRALTAKRVSSHKMGKSKGNASSVSLGNATSVSDALPRIEQNRIDNKNKKQTKLDCPIGNHLGDTSFLAIWGKWRDHLSERFKPLTPTTEETQLYKLSEFSVNEAIAIVEFSIGAGAVNLILNGDHKRKASRSAKATSFDEVF
jgi:hypothetical protein